MSRNVRGEMTKESSTVKAAVLIGGAVIASAQRNESGAYSPPTRLVVSAATEVGAILEWYDGLPGKPVSLTLERPALLSSSIRDV